MTKPSNPKRTGGPKTPEGKLTASQNSMRAGTYSRIAVLPGESESEFREVERRFVADMRPQGFAEEAMVHELALIFWKKLRLEMIEHDQYALEMNRPPTLREMAQVGFDLPNALEWVLRDLTITGPDKLARHRDDRRFLTRLKCEQARPDDLLRLYAAYPDLYDEVAELAAEYGCSAHDPNALIELKFGDEDGIEVYATQYVISEELLGEVDLLIEACEHYESYVNAYERVKSRRMLGIMQANQLARPAEDLNRTFFRTLSELRRQQEWSRKNRVIDVTPEDADTH